MFAMYASGWPSALEDPTGARELEHRIALYEARIATDWQSGGTQRPQSAGLVDRIRQAVGIAPAQPECLTCPA